MADLFASTAWYYARYRSGYPAAVFDLIRKRFDLDGSGGLLDLGCGTGEVARALHADAGEIVGVDISPEMIAEVERQCADQGIENARWLVLPAEEISETLGRFRLITMGMSFHWMRQDEVLARCHALLEPGGGIAFLGNPGGISDGDQPYERATREVIQRWLGEERRTRTGLWAMEEYAGKKSIARSRFVNVTMGEIKWERTIDIDTVVGEQFSTSHANKELLGDKADSFEADLCATLLALNPDGTFTERLSTEYIFAST